MARTTPLILAAVSVMSALALAVVLWPEVATPVMLAYFALGFAAGAATIRAAKS